MRAPSSEHGCVCESTSERRGLRPCAWASIQHLYLTCTVSANIAGARGDPGTNQLSLQTHSRKDCDQVFVYTKPVWSGSAVLATWNYRQTNNTTLVYENAVAFI